MAKSKEQKQAEAIERKRELYGKNFDVYIECQYGTPGYHQNEQLHGRAYADERAQTTARTFERYCSEARIDKHGNPLT
ncbi:hypothetical protein [Pseudomonas putida]|uniref:Uncharacterized protein n=1 Tax=Pseudomonas putida TaxID=303 RepID=A0A8I1JHY7_PSEPU|nr:hypothetical protein [Pseudomonas putida]MBI6883161.1 hypothetical protein [Pseudomonas putida]